jgi:PKD repeat protein
MTLAAPYFGTSIGAYDDVGNFGEAAAWAPAVDEFGNLAGMMPVAGVQHLVRWTPAGGLQDLGAPPTCTNVTVQTWRLDAVSPSGIVSGYANGCPDAYNFRWSEASGFELLRGPVPSDPPECSNSTWDAVVNSAGVVAGAYIHCSGGGLAAWYPDGTRATYAWAEPHQINSTTVIGINDADQVIGIVTNLRTGENEAFLWTPGGGVQFLTSSEGMFVPADINNNGTVVGYLNGGGPALRWTAGAGMQALRPNAQALGVTDDETIIGNSNDGYSRGFRWSPSGGFQDLGLMPGSPADGTSGAHLAVTAISSTGIITGSGSVIDQGAVREHAFRWTVGRGFEDLGPGIGTNSRGMSVNRDGIVAGFVFGSGVHRWGRWRLNPTLVSNANGPYSENEGAALAFSSAGSSDPGGGTLSYQWTFGDGTKSTTANPSKKYADNGTYAVRLIVRNAAGRADTATTTATITNAAPTGSLTAPASINEGSGYTLSFKPADLGTADKATLQSWLDCGQGADYQGPSTGTTITLACAVVPDQDTLTLRARVRDKDGGEIEYSKLVKVNNAGPVVTFAATSATTIPKGASVSFSGLFTDAGVNDSPWSYTITWGDGLKTTGTANAQNTTMVLSHTYAKAGAWQALLQVRDKDGKAGNSAKIPVTVSP